MQLNAQQIETFDRDGYLFFDSLFTSREIGVLREEVPRLYAERRQENVREKGSDAVRTNFAAHMYSAPFARLARHPRMIEPAMQIEPVPMAFGVVHTDSNRHVNSLAYLRVFEEAALDGGAGWWRTITTVVIPLSKSGIAIGSVGVLLARAEHTFRATYRRQTH